MPEYEAGIQSIIDGRGADIAIAGMTIVFVALSAIASLITVLPRILQQLAKVFPETGHHGAPPAQDDLAAVAAAAAAYHAHAGGGS